MCPAFLELVLSAKPGFPKAKLAISVNLLIKNRGAEQGCAAGQSGQHTLSTKDWEVGLREISCGRKSDLHNLGGY